MEKEEFRVLVKGMKAVYAQPTFIPDKYAFDVWYGLLKDLPYQQANLAIQKYMLTEKFPPTIADIRDKASEMSGEVDESMSELAAWSLVHKAICNSGYHAQEEFDKLPEACRIAIGSPANLREWSMMDSSQVETVEQSHFIRNYRAAVHRMKENSKIPHDIRQMIDNIKETARIESAREKAAIEDKEEKPEQEERTNGVPMPENALAQLKEILKGGAHD